MFTLRLINLDNGIYLPGKPETSSESNSSYSNNNNTDSNILVILDRHIHIQYIPTDKHMHTVTISLTSKYGEDENNSESITEVHKIAQWTNYLCLKEEIMKTEDK